MAADSDHPSLPAHRLAERLRDLREQERLTQKQLARALGGEETLSSATVSLWEKPGSDRLPPPPRLAAYARLFCTSRSFASGCASSAPRRGAYRAGVGTGRPSCTTSCLSLRERAQSTDIATAPSAGHRSSIWHFSDSLAVSIVCSDAPEPPRYADQSHLNYSRYARYADLDALIEVFGQIKADNAARMIRILPTESLRHDFALNHLVLIGGAASGAAQWFAQDIPLPVPERVPDADTYVFICRVGEETRKFESLHDNGTLTQDVGLIARGPHPIIPGGTVTLLSGITSRGVHGAALCFIDSHLRETNERYLEDTFRDTDSFCILMNVPVQNGAALPPNLWRDNTRLYEWSAETGAHW